LDGVLAIRP